MTMTTDEKFDLIISRLDKIDERLDKVDARLDKVDARLDKVDARLDRVENDVSDLKEAQFQTTAKLDGTIDKCIQVLYESHTMHSEKFDRVDFDSIKKNADIAVTIAKMAYDAAVKK